MEPATNQAKAAQAEEALESSIKHHESIAEGMPGSWSIETSDGSVMLVWSCESDDAAVADMYGDEPWSEWGGPQSSQMRACVSPTTQGVNRTMTSTATALCRSGSSGICSNTNPARKGRNEEKDMTRNETIARLRNTSEAYCSRIADRLGACNVRVVRTNGTSDGNVAIRCRLQALHAMLDDETIAGIEYRFNNRWEFV